MVVVVVVVEGEGAVGVCRLYEADGLGSLAGCFCLFCVGYLYIPCGRHYGRAYDGATRDYDGVYIWVDGWREGRALARPGQG